MLETYTVMGLERWLSRLEHLFHWKRDVWVFFAFMVVYNSGSNESDACGHHDVHIVRALAVHIYRCSKNTHTYKRNKSKKD